MHSSIDAAHKDILSVSIIQRVSHLHLVHPALQRVVQTCLAVLGLRGKQFTLAKQTEPSVAR